jgi:type IV pilus assembly protein PilC
MAKHRAVFPPLMVNMCRAGEVGGFLDMVLLQIADNYEAEVKLRARSRRDDLPGRRLRHRRAGRHRHAAVHRAGLRRLFADFDSALPAPTRFLVFLSGLMKVLAPLGVVALIAFAVTWPKVKLKPQVRNVLDPLKLKLPVFGLLFQKIALARFARNLGTMMKSGVPILQSLDIVSSTTGNVVLERALLDVQNSVRQGEALAQPLHAHKVFPPMVVQMMAVGEDTGALDTMLHKIAEFYDQEVEATTEALTALIEPLMIVVIGAIIAP